VWALAQSKPIAPLEQAVLALTPHIPDPSSNELQRQTPED
jgi:hypothetical protein